VIKGNLFGGKHLVFILHWIIYLVKKGETEGMLGSHIRSPTRWQVNSRRSKYFQGGSSEGI